MAKKIGDLVITLVILLFLVSGFSLFINQADLSADITTGLSSELSALEGNLSGVHNVESEFTDKVDETGEFDVPENTQTDTRASDAGGLINVFSKNVLVRWVDAVGDSLNIPVEVLALIVSLIGITVTILLVRMFIGETKV